MSFDTIEINLVFNFQFVSTGGIFFLIYCIKTIKKANPGEAGSDVENQLWPWSTPDNMRLLNLFSEGGKHVH